MDLFRVTTAVCTVLRNPVSTLGALLDEALDGQQGLVPDVAATGDANAARVRRRRRIALGSHERLALAQRIQHRPDGLDQALAVVAVERLELSLIHI